MPLQTVSRSIFDEGWTRFMVYAPFVCEIVDDQPVRGCYFALEGNLQHCLIPCPEHALLPNLTHVQWVLASVDELRVLFHLLSNCLESLEVHFRSVYNQESNFPKIADFVSLAEEIMVAAPNLKHLVLCTKRDWSTGDLKYAGNALASLLGVLPTLRHLETDIVLFAHMLCGHPPMTCLTKLRLEGPFHGPGPTSMDSISLPALQRVEGYFFQSNGQDIWAALFSCVGCTIEEIDFETDLIPELMNVISTYCVFLKVLKLGAAFSEGASLSPNFLCLLCLHSWS
jgi:hypothetical protein